MSKNSVLKNKIIKAGSCVCIFLLWSCSVEKFIPDGDVLYTGSEINMLPDSTRTIKSPKLVAQELYTVLGARPNTSFLGMRLGLYYHYKAQQEKASFITKWMGKKIGEAPVYLSAINKERVATLMSNRLDNRGFFYSTVSATVDSLDKKAAIAYVIELKKPYTLKKFELSKDSLAIYEDIATALKTSKIKVGDRFDLELLKFERQRIDAALKRKGYYNFNADFLLFEADTNRYKNKKFDLFLRLKKGVPKKSIVPYVIDSITVYPKYAIKQDSILKDANVQTVKGVTFIQEELFFKPKKLRPYILLDSNAKYDSEKARITSNRLSALGNYKFVNIRFTEKDTVGIDSIGKLNATIALSPLTKRALRSELRAVTKSNGFAGPGISLTYSDRNLFKGGETLNISTEFSYESQLSGNRASGLNSIAVGVKGDLVIPRLLPFSPSRFQYAVPKTKISLGIDALKRSQLYTLTSLNTSFGYTWQENKFVFHELNPIAINYVNLSNTTPEFEAILANNPFLRTSFEQQFIAGINYTFTYNEIVDQNKKHPIYVATSIDVAGNTLQLLSGGKPTFLGLEYAQYAKADIDFRYYLRWGREQTLVSRVYAGWGIPYGNSRALPFVKQFFSGGPYSVRAFPIRSLGPGTFTSNPNSTSSFFDQSGNMRLEANLEYRFPIWSYLKGAFFADAGNVWLTNTDKTMEDSTPEEQLFKERLFSEGKLDSNWVKQLGVGVGFGLRVDIQSFVIRFDLASPIQTPYLPEGERLSIPFFNGGANNMVLNFAIGYPF